jgi:hypothetical protein
MKAATSLAFVAGLLIVVVAFLPNHGWAQTPGCIPHLDSIRPDEVTLGVHVTIVGSCFGDGSGGSRVESTASVSQVTASDQGAPAWSDSEITIQINIDNQVRQSYSLKVVTPAGESNQVDFVIHNYSLPGVDCEISVGEINVKVFPGIDIAVVVARHGGSSFEMSIEGTTDQVLSRWWLVEVPDGEELSKVREYAADNDVEYAEAQSICQLAPQSVPALPSTGGDVSDNSGSGWMRFLAVGMIASGAFTLSGLMTRQRR